MTRGGAVAEKRSMTARRLMAVLAHPDDESLGVGGTLAKYASEGVETFLLTATRGDGGRYGNHRPGDAGHPGRSALGSIREHELRAAASVLGIKGVAVLDNPDQQLDRANPQEAIAVIVDRLHRVRPEVVVTFGPMAHTDMQITSPSASSRRPRWWLRPFQRSPSCITLRGRRRPGPSIRARSRS
jgi:LmbE family N-acetylglucosaminyl deacetylase